MLRNVYCWLDTAVSGQSAVPSSTIRVYLSLPFCISPEFRHVLIPLHTLAPTSHNDQTVLSFFSLVTPMPMWFPCLLCPHPSVFSNFLILVFNLFFSSILSFFFLSSLLGLPFLTTSLFTCLTCCFTLQLPFLSEPPLAALLPLLAPSPEQSSSPSLLLFPPFFFLFFLFLFFFFFFFFFFFSRPYNPWWLLTCFTILLPPSVYIFISSL